jgi:hypothetical protein
MTMEHIGRSFEVALSIRHLDMDPAEISTILGLTPKRTTSAGELRTTPRGERLAGRYEFSHWTHSFDVQRATELAVVLEELVEKLQGHEPFFHRVVREGGVVELFCGVFAAGNWDEVLPHSLMGRLAALRIDLRLDVYPRDDHNAA